jgi:hypothetical protein
MIKNCLFCNRLLNNPTSTKKFCRNRCRQRAYYKRKEDGPIQQVQPQVSQMLDNEITSYLPENVKPSYQYCLSCYSDRSKQKDWVQIFFTENRERISRDIFIGYSVNVRLLYENNKIYCGQCNALYHYN